MAPNNNITNIAPIDWPKVNIGKQTLQVKWSILAEYLLSLWGIDTQELLRVVGSVKLGTAAVTDEDGKIVTPAVQATADPRFTAKIFEMFAACVGHNYLQLGQDAPTAMYWASNIEDGQFPDLVRALYSAMGKRRPAAAQKAPALLATEEPAAVLQ